MSRDWPKLFVPESSVEPMPKPEQLPARGGVGAPGREVAVADEIERDVEALRVVAGVVDAAVRRLVGHLLGLDVVPLAHLDRVEPELVRDDVDDPLGEPQVLHARVAAVRRHRRLVRHHLRVVEPDVAPAVAPGRDLRPDHAAERLVAEERAGVVERLGTEPEQRAVGLDGDLDVLEPALVPVRHVLVEVRPPLGPVDRAAELPREEAARDEVRVRGDLVAEPAADVLRDEAELVEPHPHRGAHHDDREARELVVGLDRPLPDAAVVLDHRAVELERRRVEAVEVELADPHHVVRVRERALDVAPVVDALPREVAAGLVVEHGNVVLLRLARVRDRRQRLVLDLDELAGVARELARLGHDGDHGLADEARPPDGEGVVLHVRAGRRGDLEERVGEDRHLVAGERPVHARSLERLRDVDRADLRVRVRRADEPDVAHPVALHVVDEHALTLDEPPVLLARRRDAHEPLLRGLDVLTDGAAHASTSASVFPCDAATTASTMFQ